MHQQPRSTAQHPQRQAPVYQSRTQSQNPRPAVNRPQEHRPAVHQQSRPTAQRTHKQAPVYKTKEQSQEQMPVYQPKQSAQRPAAQRQATRQYHAPQSNHRRR